jgi:hypothetical protein
MDVSLVPDSSQMSEQLIDTAQHTFCVDRLRRRFRCLPRGRDPRDPNLAVVWQPYYRLWADPDGMVTITLDAAGTRRLRVLPG